MDDFENVRTIDGRPLHDCLPDAEEPETGAPEKNVILSLRTLLSMAESGELQAFILTGWTAERARVTAFKGDLGYNVIEELGGINWLAHEYVDHVTDVAIEFRDESGDDGGAS